ncbi:MAG: PEP-CTERM system histidine kinase PrsK [Rubrivivax sp.]|nr:PEP-CTERM system histidine kinase PrsK [Rubrivivax sp.]
MSAVLGDIAIVGHALSVAASVALVGWILHRGRLAGEQQRSGPVFLAALLATALWSLAAIAGELWYRDIGPWPAALADVARLGLWIGFLLQLFGTERLEGRPPLGQRLRGLAFVAVAVASVLVIYGSLGAGDADTSRPALAARLLLALLGLVAVEQVYRNAGEDMRWGVKPVCVGLACTFGFDTYVYSEALLFGRADPDAVNLRGMVQAVAVPFLFMAARRRQDWMRRLQVSRAAAFYSATLVLVGSYLLFMAAIGYYVRYFGGSWGRSLQLGLLVLGVVFLVSLAISGSLRSWLRVFVGKHFYSYRFDYREEWLRFTTLLSSTHTPQETGGVIVKGLARMVECPAGSLWTRTAASGAYAQAAAWNVPRVTATEPVDSAFCTFLRDKGWVVDLVEFRSSPRRYGPLSLPTWLLGSANPWLVVPLLAGEDMQGFVVLAQPRTAIELNWEVLDLLKTAGRQAAGYLAQMSATEELLEARKFDAFNRMSAFVVHDLKNIVAQLSLMLKNAERLRDNPEFQQDMLMTVESSLEKMRRMMLQLREGATPAGGGRGVNLQQIVGRLQALARSQGRALEVAQSEPLSTRGHEERLERVLGHLVQNALDATPPEGRVWMDLARQGSQVAVQVGDTGCGMSEEFVQNRLFRPFSTTKRSGMGIGSYESAQYIRELGGSLNVESEEGVGTVITVLLPLLDAHHRSGLMPLDAS